MDTWETYLARLNAHGSTRRDAAMKREKRFINNKTRHTLSYFNVDIDGEEREVAVINTDNLNEKWIYSMPGEMINQGSYVTWMDNHWIVTELDANTELRARAKMLQCNYLLKWVADDLSICERWCVVEDGTKYLTGEFEDRNFIVTRGDSRIAITLPRDDYTKKLDRQNRFLVDDPESEHMIAYALTKPFKLSGVYNGKGYFKFVLQEVNTTDDDNLELGIADYYKFFPGEKNVPDPPDAEDAVPGRQEVWL